VVAYAWVSLFSPQLYKQQSKTMKQTLFDAVGSLPTLKKVHKIFYDKVYIHSWIGQFFIGHNQDVTENRQTSFMADKMGGPLNILERKWK
jgi:truncated hemoglobin YjbI